MHTSLRRARPWLGTLVEIRVEGLPERAALAAIEAAFAEVAQVHRCMSFHSPDSDLSRLHSACVGQAVAVDTRCMDVMRCALRIAESSDGCFDPTIGSVLVASGRLPAPHSMDLPSANVSWRDIELLDANHICLRRAAWLDLGGIAKGYAVDRAIDILRQAGATQACVNAGGDLRVFGARAECIDLRIDPDSLVQCIEIRDAAVASSAARDTVATHRLPDVEAQDDQHRINRRRARRAPMLGVSVLAESCMHADALTKVVLNADAQLAASVLASFAGQACVHHAEAGWLRFDHAA